MNKNSFKNISTKPGIYFFKDKKDKVLYIGKAKNLKKRISSYFSKNDNIKNKIMFSKAKDIETMIVNNEVEALLVEANMIKKYKPKYNVLLKDDKTFPYIVITNEKYPRVEIIREKNLKKNNNIYFGPYTDVSYLRTVLRTLHQLFSIRTCTLNINNDSIINKKHQICLDYHIGKCDGPCEGFVSEKNYSKIIDDVIKFLKGKNNIVKKRIKDSIYKYSEKQMYEQAAKYRDQLIALDNFEKKQTKISQKFKDKDVINISYHKLYAIAFIMRVRNGLLIGKDRFELKYNEEIPIINSYSTFLVQYYKITTDIPSEIILDYKIKDKYVLEEWLSSKKGKKVKIIKPLRGESKNILDLCVKNSDMILKGIIAKKIKNKEYIPKTLQELKDFLNMTVLPRRIEAFDNSNLNGKYPVSGMVSFFNGKPIKKEYRKFNIRTVRGIDDFESMREVIFRRYSRLIKEKKIMPDLILIDGGKGQLSAAKSTLDKLGLGYISIIGLAKKLEDVYLPESLAPQNIPKTSSALHLLRRIRDEVHRFSITFHRKKRKDMFLKSFLNDIPGLGIKRIQKIWKKYNNIDELLNDSNENIKIKTSIPLSIIENIKNNKRI